MIVNKYNNGGGGSGSGVTPQDVQRQIDSALTPYWESGETKDYVDEAVSGISLEGYWTSAETQSAITQSVSGKADAANVTARVSKNSENYLPAWNEQGVITGDSGQRYESFQIGFNGSYINGLRSYTGGGSMGMFYAPKSVGTAGDILVSTGNGAPVWSAVTMPEVKTVVDFDHTTQAERAAVYAELKALYDGGSGATINKTYDFYKTVNTWQGLKIDYYSFSGGSLVFGKVVSPENITDQVVYEQVMTIDAEGNVAVVTNTVGGGADMSGYWNSAETKDYVDSTVADFLDDEDGLVISSAINDLRGLIEVISAATPEVDLSGYYTSAQTEEAITSKNYVTSAQVETQIEAKNYITSGQAKDQIEAYNYVTSADVETQILSKNYITSADTVDFLDAEDGLVISTALNNLDGKIEDVSDHLDEVERITASAYTELHDGILDLDDRVDDVETSLASKVSSSTVSTIWKGTQAQYDAITTKDPATFYIIVSSN